MTKRTLSLDALPHEVRHSLRELGNRIRTARLRRRLSQAELAASLYVTRKTLARLENGDPGVSLAVFATALFAFGLHGQLDELVTPQSDVIGLWHAERQLPKRVRRRPSDEEKLDF